jgi:hypothetical protein
MILSIAAALAGGLFSSDAQARGGTHGVGLEGSYIGSFHAAPIGNGAGRIRMSSAGDYNITGNDYSIMTPEKGSEPWLAPMYKSPRGTVTSVIIPRSRIVTPPSVNIPPSVFVPQTGQTFQNMPTLSGSGVGGAETFQDRAARCAHQAGVYGQATSGSYMGACINQ